MGTQSSRTTEEPPRENERPSTAGNDQHFDVFLSHAGYGAQKTGIVTLIYNELRSRDVKTFFDRDSLLSLREGELAPPKMVWAAATAKVVVVVLSPEYISRVWTLKEVEIALARCGGASSRRESARRFRGDELSFKDFLVKRFSEVELDLVREMEFETDGFPGDVFPLFFTLRNGECGHIQSTLDKYPEVGRCFGQWSVADDSNKQSYPGRWKTVLSHLKDITGPEFQIYSDDEPSYAKRVAKLLRDRYFPGRRLQIRRDDPRKPDTIKERVREEIPSFLELPEIWRGIYPPLQRSQCDILQFCVRRELGGDIEVVGNMNVRDIVMPDDPDWEQLQGIIQSETRFAPVWLSSSAADVFVGLQELLQDVNERLESGRRSGMVDLLAHREKLSQINGTAFVRHVEPLIRKHEDAIVAALQATLCVERPPAHVYLIAGVVFADLRATAEVRRSSVVNDDAIESGRDVPDYILSKDCAVAIQLMRFKLETGSEHPDVRDIGVRSTDHERAESEKEHSSRTTEICSDGGASPDIVSSDGRHPSGRTVRPWRLGDLTPLDETDEVTCIRPMMSNGPKGLHSDPVYAFELHRRAARLGFAASIDKLGVCYRDGIGIENDSVLAVELFQKAAERGQADSLYNLGLCFEHGQGVVIDFARALDLFQRAVGLGHLDAAYRLALFKLYGVAQNQDISGAYEALKSLAHQNHVASLRECAYLHMCPFIAPHGASIVDTRELLLRAIHFERGDSSIYMLAHILASTHEIEYIREARELVSRIPNENRMKVLMNFIEDQLSDQEYWNWNVTPASDFISGAELQLVARIGCGQFAQLFLARFRRKKWAAVKYIAGDCEEFALLDFFRERFTCQVLRAVELPGVTRYLGWVNFGCGQSGLVFELCADISTVESEAISIVEENRFAASAIFTDFRRLPDWSSRVRSNLRQSVVFSPRQRWPTKRIIGMLQRVATALMKLHECGFVHRDIAARNVLCDVDGQVQLADFGLAKFVGSRDGDHYGDVYTSYYKTYLTVGHHYALSWWAPECVQEAVFSAKSDVYSFGILMWQCFSHRDPFDEAHSLESHENTASAIVTRILSGERPSFEYLDSGVPAGLLDLMSSSWEADPDKRPSMGGVKAALAQIEASISTEPVRQVARNSRKLKEKWFDVRATYYELPSTYHELPLRSLRVEKSSVASAAAFSRFHSESIPDARRPVKGSGDLQHYDVFLVHSGQQKMVEAATMKAIMSSGRLECFLDSETIFVSGPPIKEIQCALETCRYAVAVVSRSFLSKRVPWNELVYSCERDRWVRRRYQKWETLWIVLYDLSVSEFQEACASSSGPVPDISSKDVRLIEWSRQNTWVELCQEVMNQILRQDESATEQWADFLDNWQQSDSPRADWVYK